MNDLECNSRTNRPLLICCIIVPYHSAHSVASTCHSVKTFKTYCLCYQSVDPPRRTTQSKSAGCKDDVPHEVSGPKMNNTRETELQCHYTHMRQNSDKPQLKLPC